MAFATTDITPTLPEVAAYIRSRTRDVLGNELGTFTGDTRPTDGDAQGHAERAAGYVALRVGRPGTAWTGDLEAAARNVAALYAALTIEQSYYSDGSAPDDTGTDQLGRMVREQLDALIETARNNQTGGWRMTSIQMVPAGMEEVAGTGDEVSPGVFAGDPDSAFPDLPEDDDL